MDIALSLEKLVPAANYFGSLTSNKKEDYDKLIWNDLRVKPTFSEIIQAWSEIEPEMNTKEDREKLIQDKIRKLAIIDLISKGKLPVNYE